MRTPGANRVGFRIRAAVAATYNLQPVTSSSTRYLYPHPLQIPGNRLRANDLRGGAWQKWAAPKKAGAPQQIRALIAQTEFGPERKREPWTTPSVRTRPGDFGLRGSQIGPTGPPKAVTGTSQAASQVTRA
jgi:hypothetical protein